MTKRTRRGLERLRWGLFAAYILIGLAAWVGLWSWEDVSFVLFVVLTPAMVLNSVLIARGPRGRERPLDLDAKRLGRLGRVDPSLPRFDRPPARRGAVGHDPGRPKGHRDNPVYADVVYVGRAMHRGGWHLQDSRWPARTAPVRTACGTRLPRNAGRTCSTARSSSASSPGLLGRRLGCLVRAGPCHAKVIADSPPSAGRPIP